MRITRIDFEGKKEGHYATAQKRSNPEGLADFIDVTILTPEIPSGIEYHVHADLVDDIRDMAERIQFAIDGYSDAEPDDYYNELIRLADIDL